MCFLSWPLNKLLFTIVLRAQVFFMFILLISNHKVFLVQFEINLHVWVFQKDKIALAGAARAISVLLKNLLVQINSKLNSKPYDYQY